MNLKRVAACLLVVFCVEAFPPAWCNELLKAPNLKGLSPSWRRFLDYEWNFNNANRLSEEDGLISLADRQLRIVYYFSRFRPVDNFSRSLLERYRIRFPSARKNRPMEGFGLEIGNSPPQGTLRAVRIQGRASFLIWSSSGPASAHPIFLKRYKRGHVLPVEITHFLGDVFDSSGEPDLDFMAEIDDYENFITRPSESYFQRRRDPHYVPGHGYLNHSHRKAFEEWKLTEFVPKFGRSMARLNRYGIFHSSHSQNIMLRLSRAEKIVDRIILKDLGDIRFDPVGLFENSIGSVRDRFKLCKRLGLGGCPHSEDLENCSAGHFLYNYPLQSVAHVFGFKIAYIRRALAVFLEFYLAETNRIVGKGLQLSPDALVYFQKLRGHYSQDADLESNLDSSDIFINERDLGKRLEYMAEYILQDIYDKASQAQLPDIPSPELFSQTELRRLVTENFASNMWSVVNREAWAAWPVGPLAIARDMSKRFQALRYSYLDGRLFILSPSNTLFGVHYLPKEIYSKPKFAESITSCKEPLRRLSHNGSSPSR